MAINCEKCQYFDEDYLFDEETGDQSPFFSCDKNHNDELYDDLCTCPYFKKYKIVRHVEKDTKCDNCHRLPKCIQNGNVVLATDAFDTREHYFKGLECGARMCDFCKNIGTGMPEWNFLTLDENGRVSSGIEIEIRKIIDKHALVFTNSAGEYGAGVVDIAFCPMCGRKLVKND